MLGALLAIGLGNSGQLHGSREFGKTEETREFRGARGSLSPQKVCENTGCLANPIRKPGVGQYSKVL